MREFFYSLLLLDKAVQSYHVSATRAEIIAGLIAYIHETRRRESGRTKLWDDVAKNDYQKKYFAKVRAQGRCVKCSEPLTEGKSTWYCEKHLEAARLNQQQRRERMNYGRMPELCEGIVWTNI